MAKKQNLKNFFQTREEAEKAIMDILNNFEYDLNEIKSGIETIKKDMVDMDLDILVELYDVLVKEEEKLHKLVF